jgi:murein DD-endopeptidase MepM/ murein hydrolase activator NlpD
VKSAKIDMRGPVYRYNASTCRYERIGVSPTDVITYTFGLALCSAAILAGLLLLHDFMTETPAEKAFRKENIALEKYQQILSQQLERADEKLAVLRVKDDNLHNKFFASVSNDLPSSNSSDHSKENILLAEAPLFENIVAELNDTSHKLINESINSSLSFADQHQGVIGDKSLIATIPLHRPILDLTPDKLISGFGLRINPFHKGLYDHFGIDIAVPRGTEVLATASGLVIAVKRSDLQAGYGNYIEIDHRNGFITRYSHLEDIKVRQGQKISGAVVIGTTGNSGGSVAPHLHYEVIHNGKNVDPVLYMISGVSTALYEQLRAVSAKQNQSLD